MRVTVTVHPGSREEKVEEGADGSYIIRVKAQAERGKANAAAVELLSEHLNAKVRIVSGFTSRHKTVEVW